MKKHSEKYRIRNLKRRSKIEKRKALSKQKKKLKISLRIRHKQILMEKSPPGAAVARTIIAPEKLDINADYKTVASFLEAIRSNAHKKNGRFSIDFRPIKHIDPCSALMLAAEIDRWRIVKGVTLKTYHLDEWNPNVRALLKDLGFFELYGITPPSDETDDSRPIKMLKFCSGLASDGSLAKQMRSQMEEIAGEINARKLLYDGITEAMTNVCHHAYSTHSRYPVSSKRWWMAGAFDSERNTMRFMVFDQGVGIPGTLPRSTLWERSRAFLINWGLTVHDDASMIRAAMETSRTSTGLENRGHGLRNIMKFIDDSNAGRLRILSRRGEVLYHHGARFQRKSHQSAIGGTLIEWEVSR